MFRKENKNNVLFEQNKLWNLFISDICNRNIETLNDIQIKAVLCFWYDAEMNSGGHSGYFDCYPETNPMDLYGAIKDVSNIEIADNYKEALENGKADDYNLTDNAYYAFKPSLCEYLEKYIEYNKNEIFNDINFPSKSKEELKPNIKKLYNKIVENNNIKGSIKLENDWIIWNIYKNYIIRMAYDYNQAYIDINTLENEKLIDLTHWHPEFGEVYDDFLELNDENNIIVIRIKRMSGGYKIVKKDKFKQENYKNNFFHKYYIIGEIK